MQSDSSFTPSLFSLKRSTEANRMAALRARDEAWQEHGQIHSWVDLASVGLDRFFTRADIARECLASLMDEMASDHAAIDGYWFVEPSAGSGIFYDLLPPQRRTGIEIVRIRPDFEWCDFLSWRSWE